MACIRYLQQRSSKLPLRACLSFQYLSCFAKYLAKNFNSAVSSISCVFAEPIEAFGSTMACIRYIQKRTSKLPLRACLSFQYLSCFAKYLAKNFNSAVSSISCVFAEPIRVWQHDDCIYQHSSMLPLCGGLPFQYLSCFAKYLAKFAIQQFPQFHVCLQSLL